MPRGTGLMRKQHPCLRRAMQIDGFDRGVSEGITLKAAPFLRFFLLRGNLEINTRSRLTPILSGVCRFWSQFLEPIWHIFERLAFSKPAVPPSALGKA
jgi:hypothetical protein